MKEFELKYGCNPNQKPARIYMSNGGNLPIQILNGRPGYINFLDAFNAWQLVKELNGDTDVPGWDADLLKMLDSTIEEADEIVNDYGSFPDTEVANMNRRPVEEHIPYADTPSYPVTPPVDETPPAPAQPAAQPPAAVSVRSPVQVKVVPCIQLPAHRPVRRRQLPGVQCAAHLCRQAAAPRHHSVR